MDRKERKKEGREKRVMEEEGQERNLWIGRRGKSRERMD